ncbi:MAG: glycosyltransferase family 4 protein [Acidimicrobiales bacterium]|nr:glycosyltransferase family 4 protein [Acidimicrobiales bacterium]
MRVTVLCTDLGVRVPGDKGASMHLAAVTESFIRLGHEVQLVGVAGHGTAPVGLADCRLLPHPGRTEGIARERNKLAFVRRVVDEAGPHVQRFAPELIYERLALFGTAGTHLARAVGCLRALEVNALLAEEEARWRGLHHVELADRRERVILGSADVVVAVSDEVLDGCRRRVPAVAGIVVPNGMDAARFAELPVRSEARRRLGLPPDRPLAVFVGTLRPWHGVDVAIDALARSSTAVELVVVGDGPVAGELLDQARRAGVEHRVHLLGHRGHAEVAVALAAADVALAPYPALDGFAFSPLKLFEYLAAGVPVVASRIGQVTAVLEGDAEGPFGTMVEPGDPAALAAAVDRVLADPAARATAARARAHALVAHSWDQRVGAVLAAVERAARPRPEDPTRTDQRGAIVDALAC